MEKIFDKNIFRDTNKKIKVIIDTDPGVDDAACLVYAFADENLDISAVAEAAAFYKYFAVNYP